MNQLSLKRTVRSAVLMACAPLLYSGASFAQPEDEGRMDAIQEVIVTAQKREEDMQKVPISLVALDSDKLDQLQIAGIADIASKIPNVRTDPFPYSPSTIRVFMRGIGYNDANLTTDASAGVYFNGVYVGRSAGLSMDVADLERMEVLRGPQGTLYGRNTIGGAISMITAKPTGEFGLKQEVSAGNYDFWKIKTQINLPSIGNLSTKFSYLKSSRGGLVKNTGVGPDFGEDDKEGLMLALRWTPTDAIAIDYTFDKAELDYTSHYWQATQGVQSILEEPGYGSLCPLFGCEVPLEPDPVTKAQLLNPFQGSHANINGHNLTINWDLTDGLALKSISAYRELREKDYADYSANPDFLFFANSPVDQKQQQFSQEFQLVGGQAGGRLSYVAGVYYFRESGSEFETDLADPLIAQRPDGILTQRFVTAENSTSAVYGQGTYAFTDALRLTLGGRYTKDKRETVKQDIYFSRPGVGDKSFSRFTPSISVDWEAREDLMFYGKVVTGFKSGGFNLRSFSPEDFERGFDSEKLTSYELGMKGRWLDNRLQVNTAAFHMDHKDIQVGIPVVGNPSLLRLFNAGKAKIDGLELEITAVPFEGMLVNLNYGYLDARFTEVLDPDTGNNIADQYTITKAPENSFSADATYTFGKTRLGTLSGSIDYNWQDDYYTQGDATPTGARGGVNKAYGLLGARLTLADIAAAKAKVKVSLWGRNLTDEDWAIDTIGSFRNFIADQLTVFGAGRTYGVDVTFEL